MFWSQVRVLDVHGPVEGVLFHEALDFGFVYIAAGCPQCVDVLGQIVAWGKGDKKGDEREQEQQRNHAHEKCRRHLKPLKRRE